ncbi:MAG: flavodoxin [Methanosphaera stadtmanae]|nr:flavodoxin [Methanosphaera stadtmanae]
MKTLLVYYGYGIHTQMISEMIKEKIDCDVYRIKPIEEYSDDYDLVVKQTEDNLQSRKTPEIEEVPFSLDDYDKIILGTPVWWYTITPPVRTFLTKYDLSNKEVIAYATNAGWLGNTFEEIEELIQSKLTDKISIKFTVDYSENQLVTSKNEINRWIDEINKL